MSKVYRAYQQNFTQISNEIIHDKELSFKAKGIYLHLVSKPDGWEYNMTEIQRSSADGKDSVRSGIKELEESGYLERKRAHSDDGRFDGYDYLIFAERRERRHWEEPADGKPDDGKADDVEPATSNTNQTNTERSKTDDNKKTSKKEIILTQSKLDAKEVAEYLAYNITAYKPNAKPKPGSWVNDIEAAIRIDGRTKHELIACIDWIYRGGGDFWIPNIMSGKKLRDKYDQLEMQAKRGNNKKPDAMQERIARMAAEGRLG